MTGIMDRAYETVGSTDMEHFSGGLRILFEAIHAVWSAASKVLTGQTCHELLETFGSIFDCPESPRARCRSQLQIECICFLVFGQISYRDE